VMSHRPSALLCVARVRREYLGGRSVILSVQAATGLVEILAVATVRPLQRLLRRRSGKDRIDSIWDDCPVERGARTLRGPRY
jgi:hypothetical protein